MPFHCENQAPRRGTVRRAASLFCGALALFLACLLSNAPAGAVTLRQQWVPGQQLTYDTVATGKLTLLADDESPQPWAGLPTDFRVRGNAAMTLDTVAVDEFGIGTVALRMGDGRLRAQGIGQVFEMTVKDGQITMLMNGKPAGGPNAPRTVATPRWAFKLAPEGRLEAVVPLDKPGEKAGKAEAGKTETPFDFTAAAEAWILRALPTLWPKGEVNPGEQWTVPLAVPLPPVEKEKDAPAPLPVGQVTFTLRGEEEMAGRKAQRVTLTGGFALDEAKAKTIGAAPDGKNETPPMKLADARQKLTGDLWLDVATGQLVRVELALQTQLHSKGVIKNKAGKTRPTENWADFDGSLQMQLRKVSYSSGEATSNQ